MAIKWSYYCIQIVFCSVLMWAIIVNIIIYAILPSDRSPGRRELFEDLMKTLATAPDESWAPPYESWAPPYESKAPPPDQFRAPPPLILDREICAAAQISTDLNWNEIFQEKIWIRLGILKKIQCKNFVELTEWNCIEIPGYLRMEFQGPRVFLVEFFRSEIRKIDPV